MLKKKDRADRILILLALAVLLGSSGLFYFDDWMWGGRRRDQERIGTLSTRNGDVRMKFTGDLKWQKAAGGQDLIYNDSIYVGEGSEARLALGDSEMTVSEKTLVVLRRQNQTNFMNLSYGSLLGKIAKNERVVIDTGDGHPIELRTSKASEIVVRKVSGKTELNVVSGEAEIKVDGRKTNVNRASRLVIEKNVAPKVEEVALELVKPLHGEVLYSEQPGALDFEWRWSSGQKPGAAEKFKIEFSGTPDFARVANTREVAGKTETHFKASQSLNYFYRVKGPRAQVSATERVSFVRMHKPVVLQPRRDSVFESTALEPAVVGMQVEKDAMASVNYQIASDADFKSVLDAGKMTDTHAARSLGAGKYFLRAQSEYGPGHLTSWSDPVAFSVEDRLQPMPLGPELSEKTRVLIPNREYPADLYKAAPANVAGYLTRHGFLRHFFPNEDFDQMNLVFDSANGDQDQLSQTNSAWPTGKMKPGRYRFKYQYLKNGFAPSSFSQDKKLEIALEPPRPSGEAAYGVPDAAGVSQVHWNFTPLLFAKSYDVELSGDPGLRNARAIEVYKSEVDAKVRGESYYRVRARDGKGRLISDFSPVYKLEGAIPPALAVAQPEPEPAPRAPAAVESTSDMKVEATVQGPVHKNGWWAWVGGGENYVDYKQTSDGRASFDDHHIRAMSEYAEAGFIGDQSIGGVITIGFNPGQIDPYNAQIDHNNYTWTSISFEALARRYDVFRVFGTPVSVDLRLGLEQNTIPFVFLDSFGDLFLKKNQMTSATIGAAAEMQRARWTYLANLRYEYPFSSTADGAASFSISPIISFSGSVGAAYHLTQRLRAGLFANGQLQEFNYSYSDGQVTNRGLQTLFFSNLDFRMGYEF